MLNLWHLAKTFADMAHTIACLSQGLAPYTFNIFLVVVASDKQQRHHYHILAAILRQLRHHIGERWKTLNGANVPVGSTLEFSEEIELRIDGICWAVAAMTHNHHLLITLDRKSVV